MTPLPFAKDQRYLVLGYGKSGKASAAALKESGAHIIVWDDKEDGNACAARDGFAITDPATIDFKDLVAMIMAPGIPLTHPTPHPAVLKARAAGVPILCDMDLLFKACPKATYVGITGTNGKSTTTALIAHVLRHAGRQVQMGGNIGTPALALDPLGEDGFYVLELSSYQLDLMKSNPLAVAVLLNITPDHFERHGGISGYIDAKMKIARKDGPQTIIMGTDEPETQHVFSNWRTKPHLNLFELSTRHEVNQGVKISSRMLYITNQNEPVDLSPCLSLPGLHNAQNAAAAFEAGLALGLTRNEIMAGLLSFPGLAHRQQLVAEIKGVRFINDSKATNADAASKALVCYENIYWIIGGRPKVGGLQGLEPYHSHIAHAFIIGEASDNFAMWCEAQNVPFTKCDTLDVATQQAASMAWNNKRKNAVVLLSPACASWDQFSSFEQRGECFAALAQDLEKDS